MKARVSRLPTAGLRKARARVICAAAVLLAHHATMAQAALPVLNANSRTVDVRDGDRLLKGDWIIDPAVALDVYDARRTTGEKRVTFITDVDSMSFDVRPGRTYDFIILLNGKDACRTRLSTLTRGYTRVGPGSGAGPDTIPITITHGKLHIPGTINGSEMLDLIFDTGADGNALYPSAMGKRAELRFDGTTKSIGTGGVTQRQTSSDNRLEVAGLRWDHEPVMYVEKQADRAADGIVGYPVFQGKVVEIDYDRMVMIVHDALPAHAAGYAKTAMPYSGALTAVEAVLVNGEARASGLFALDTGGTGAMMVNQAFAAAHGLHGAMRVLGKSTSRGLGSRAVRNEVVLLPELVLAGGAIPNVPIHLELPSDCGKAPPGGALCMEVLERFNTILDYPRNEAYFKPNAHFNAAFRTRRYGVPWPVVGGVAVVSTGWLAGLALLSAKRRRGTQGVPAASEAAHRRITGKGVGC